MQLLLRDYSLKSGRKKSEIRLELVRRFELNDQNCHDWWSSGRPPITIDFDPKTHAVIAVYRGESVKIKERCS